jgi:hypothetical protein
MSKKQAVIMEILRILHSSEIKGQKEKVIKVTLSCGSKVSVLIELKEDEKPKLKLIKDAS